MKNKVLIFIAAFLIIIFSQLYSKENKPANIDFNDKVYLGFNIGLGFFSPSDVNAVLKEAFRPPSGYYYTETYGFSEMILNFLGNASFFYRLNKNIEFQFALEGGLGPKFINSDGYYFNRYGPGVMINCHLPLGKGKNSLFISPGVLYHIMSFDNYNHSVVKASAPGLRLTGGYSLTFGSFNPRIYIGYDYTSTSDSKYQINGHDFELNYSSFIFGIYLNFMLNR